MLIETLIKLFKRDLTILIKEIESFSSPNMLWEVKGEIKNSAGNLCLHLVGNLNAFIGASIGNTGYVRQRDLEFSLKNVPKETLIKQIENTIDIVETTLNKLSKADLQKEYKRRVNEQTMTTEYFLVHLAMHLSYHLGQVNYLRRMQE